MNTCVTLTHSRGPRSQCNLVQQIKMLDTCKTCAQTWEVCAHYVSSHGTPLHHIHISPGPRWATVPHLHPPPPFPTLPHLHPPFPPPPGVVVSWVLLMSALAGTACFTLFLERGFGRIFREEERLLSRGEEGEGHMTIQTMHI